MKVQTTFKSNIFDKQFLQQKVAVTNNYNPIQQSAPEFKTTVSMNQSENSKNTPLSGANIALWIVLTAATLGSIKGIKKLTNKLPKQVVEFLENKSAAIDEIRSKTTDLFNYHLNEAKDELAKLFVKPILDTKEVSEMVEKLQITGNKEELLCLEDSCFNTLYKWFDKNLTLGKKDPTELTTKYNKIIEKFEQQINQAEQNSLTEIKIQSEIPKDIKGKKRVQKALATFDFTVNESTRAIKESKEDTLDILRKEARDLYREYNNFSEKTIVGKNTESQNILSASENKLANFVNSALPVTKITDKIVNLNIIPTSVPQSILDNGFYKFISKTDPQKLDDAIPGFVEQMDEKLSLKDIQHLIQRLELRLKATSNDVQSLNWHDNKIKQLKDGEEKISAYLDNSFYKSGNNIDANNLSHQQEESIIFALQQYSKKMGIPSVEQMIYHFSIGDMAKDGQLPKDYLARMEKYKQSAISNIYPKIKDKCGDFNRLFAN